MDRHKQNHLENPNNPEYHRPGGGKNFGRVPTYHGGAGKRQTKRWQLGGTLRKFTPIFRPHAGIKHQQIRQKAFSNNCLLSWFPCGRKILILEIFYIFNRLKFSCHLNPTQGSNFLRFPERKTDTKKGSDDYLDRSGHAVLNIDAFFDFF